MATTTPNTCPTCNGTGEYPEDTICSTCLGRSTIPVKGLDFLRFKEMRTRLDDMEDKLKDIMDKCNDIFEQLTE